MPTEEKKIKEFSKLGDCDCIENNARNNIKYTLDGVFDFMNFNKDMAPQYKVFELFVICWAGTPKNTRQDILSRVDIELINEQIILFRSRCSYHHV
jgi:hypothetical protein